MFWKIVTAVHVFLYRISGGRIGASADRHRFLLLTTTGRKTGQERTVALGYFDLKGDGGYIVVASNSGLDRHPGWFLNLRSDPGVTIQVGKQVMPARAEIISSEEREALWPDLLPVGPQYEGYQAKTKREIPLVALYPQLDRN